MTPVWWLWPTDYYKFKENRETQNYAPDEKERDYPINLVKFPYKQIDSLQIKLPKDYSIEAGPEVKNIIHPFGRFETKYRIENGIFYYKRIAEHTVDLIYPKDYNAFSHFYKTIVETDKSRFVFKER